MNYFTKRLYTWSGDSEFIFNRTATADAARYHVSARNGGGKAFYFTMEGAGDAWQIVNAPKVPDWVLQAEKVLSEEIIRRSA